MVIDGHRTDAALNFVDLDRYPIDDMDGKGAAFVRDCHSQMRTHGWCNLSGFIRPDALEHLAEATNQLLPEAESLTIQRNIYGEPVDPHAAPDDPRGREFVHHPLQLADDQLPTDSLLRALYESKLLTEFVRRVQGKKTLHRYADEFQALNVIALPPGAWHAWHYDHNECTVTLLLQAAERGGDFTFVPNTRTATGEDRQAVIRLLDGDTKQARTLSREAGALTLFRGEYSLHGVTQVKGMLPRVTAIFTYDEQPNRVASDAINIRIYGDRVKKILEQRHTSEPKH